MRGYKSGEGNPKWKGGVHIHIHIHSGYKYILNPGHPRAKVGKQRYVKESILIAEKALRKSIPLGSSIHHVNGDRMDNGRGNLVICQDESYHRLLHYRSRALKECGDVHKRFCPFCGEWDDVSNLFQPKNREGFYHRECRRKYLQEWRKNKKEAQCV
jgi:hypothetical protein